MLHFSSFHPKHTKTAIPYGQALRVHQICSDEKERDGHLEVLRDALTRTGNDAQLIERQFQHATARNRNDLLRRQTCAATNRVPLVVQYFPGVEKLRHVLRDLQHIINEDEHLSKTLPTPPLLALKQPPNLKQIIVRSRVSGQLYTTLSQQGCPEAWYIGETKQRLRQWMNGHLSTINRQECSLPLGNTSVVQDIRPWTFG
ncbi:uncharacterized protein LOC132832794 [Hemiscyllium ocellatum]|uniref:uncharacterized protein LOC132832794 n=1 Tax=Hemiscyllium ocellatum TaxID=170820 RepID=UPI00296715D4|nr:uncharacterized protein LOC132832794 [Hemiscyllium ocellatum]